MVSGQVSFERPDATTLNITNSPGAVINWQSFSIAPNELTRFIQQSSASSVLNRVIGHNPSQLLGQLTSNGRVFIINPNGVIFGPNSVIDVAGLITSTLNVADADFMAGRFHFEGDDAGGIRNEGFIRSAPGGEIVLIAPSIENSGIIETEDGTLILAAGESVTLTSLDLEGVQFEVQAPQHEVLNLGELIATHGAAGVFAGTIRHSGVIEANTLSVDEAGAIVLSARSDIHVEAGSVIEAAGVRGGEINIESEEGATWVTGVLDASGSESVGGRVEVLGERVAVIAAARVDASGETGGGEILIGGDLRGENAEIRNAARTVVGADARLLAGAGSDGDGGKIIVWSDEMTKFAGRISATGGSNSGDGGFVETSGKAHLEANGMVDASAVTGLPGTWLLDPFDTDLSNTATFGGAFSGGDPNIFTPTSDNAVVNIGEVVTSLEGGTDVEVNTGNAGVQAGDITVVDSITANLTNGDVSLTLSAANDLGINAAITATGANTLTLTLVADNDLADGGGITIAADINTNGGLVDAASAGSGNVSLTGNRTITSDFDVTLLNIAGGIQTFDGTTNVVDLEQLGTISIPADRQMNLAGVMNWTAGNISGGGTLAIQPGGTVNQLVNGPNVFLSGATIDNQGTFNLSPVTQTFFFSANSVFDNQVGGVFNFQNDFDVLTSGAGGDFNNFGTVTKTGGNGSSGFAVRFNNQDGGSVDGGTGNVGLDATGTHSGALIGVGDARFNATQNMAAGSSIAGTLGLFGNLDVSNSPTVTGTLNWFAGSIVGAGALVIAPGGTVNQLVDGSNTFLSASTIDNQGTFNHNSGSNTFFFSAGGVFNNQAGGVFNFQNDFDVQASGGGGDFNNFGTVRKTGGGADSVFRVRFNNQDGGIVDGGTGNIGLNATGTQTGVFIGIGDVRFNALQNMAAGSSIAGTVGLFSNLDVTNGPTVTGTLNWFNGNVTGGGTLFIAPGGTVNQLVNGPNTFLSASTIDNQGTFNHNSGSNTFFFSAGGVFNNQAGGVFNFQNDFDVQASGGGGDFNNFGTVRKTGGGADSVFRVRFNNQDGGIVDGGTGNIGLNATGTQTGVFIGIGDVRFNALQNMAAGSSIAGTVGLFSNLDVTNGPTVTGTLNWFNGNVTGGGTLFIAPGGTVNQLVNGPNTFLSASTIDNQGTFNHNSGSNTFFFSAGGVFNNQAGGVFNFQNDFDVQSSGGGGTFNNAGTVQKTGGGLTSSINVTFDTNNGVIDAQTGTISVSDLATNNGTVSSATGAFIITSANLANFGTIAGNGTLNANVTNNAGGIIAPGQSGGALTISGTLNLLVNGDLDIELDGTSPGVGGHDQLIVTGATALAGDLNATLGFAVTNGNTFDFLTSAGGTSGTFDNVNLPTADFALSGEGTNTLTITFGGVCGADVCWTNAGPDLSWTTDANWSTGTKPGLLDNVLLPTGLGGTITLDTGAQTIATLISDESLVINGATLTVNGAALFNSPLTIDGGGILNLPGSGNRVTTTTVTSGIIDSDGDLAINTVLNLTAGIFRGAGTTTVASGAAFNVDGNFLFEDNDLVNNGTLTVSADLSLGLLNTVTNNSGGVIDITGDFDMVGGGSSVDNAGVWRKSGGASDSFSDLIVTNTGSIESQSGRFNLNGPGDHSGGTLFANTGSFVLTNSHSFDRDSSINGSGDLTASGNLTIDGSFALTGTATFSMATVDIDNSPTFATLDVANATVRFNGGNSSVTDLVFLPRNG